MVLRSLRVVRASVSVESSGQVRPSAARAVDDPKLGDGLSDAAREPGEIARRYAPRPFGTAFASS
jgi:hypothetical protein